MSDPLVDIRRQRDLGVLATVKRDGRPQLSNVNYTFDEASRLIRAAMIADRRLVLRLRIDRIYGRRV